MNAEKILENPESYPQELFALLKDKVHKPAFYVEGENLYRRTLGGSFSLQAARNGNGCLTFTLTKAQNSNQTDQPKPLLVVSGTTNPFGRGSNIKVQTGANANLRSLASCF